MPYCSACGTRAEAENLFCSSCGHQLNERQTRVSTLADAPKLPPDPSHSTSNSTTGAIAARHPHHPGVAALAIAAFGLCLFSLAIAGLLLIAWVGVGILGAQLRSIWWVYYALRLVPWLNVQANLLESSMLSDAMFGVLAMTALAGLYAIVSYGLWKHRRWGYVLAIVVTLVGIGHALSNVFSDTADLMTWLGDIGVAIPFEACVLAYLLRSHVRQAFTHS